MIVVSICGCVQTNEPQENKAYHVRCKSLLTLVRKRLDMKKHYYRQLNSKGYVFRYYSESYAKFLNEVYGYNFELVAVTFKFAKD